MQPDERQDLADTAAPLDALLVDAALGTRRFLPDASTAKLAGSLLLHPRTTGRRLGGLAAEITRAAAGRSTVAPDKRDRRFNDAAWASNPVLRRVLQAYLATADTAGQLVTDAGLSKRDELRTRVLVDNLVEALSPSNVPWVNPAAAKAAVDTFGLNFVRGGVNLARDLISAPRVPQMVDGSAFSIGRNIAATPGAVVLRTEQLELIQYVPQTSRVREHPILIVPPTINKYYAFDLAPGRSLIEYLVRQGFQVFVISWRNPDARHADWGFDTYVRAIIDALDGCEKVAGTHRTALFGFCSGGILSTLTAAVLTATGEADRLAAFALGVTVLDYTDAGVPGALVDRNLATAAKSISRRKGYLDGRNLAEVFAWLRPGDLIWNYWVNNYLLGRKPAAFDILFWNADTTRMSARLHADFVDTVMDNALATPGALTVRGVPVDLSRIETDTCLVAGIADHLTPWESCYRTTQLLGGTGRFILSGSGHIAALVNPPGNPKATYRINPDNPPQAKDWLAGAQIVQGSWWPDAAAWFGELCGPERPAPTKLGGGGLDPLVDAPGTYVFDT
jgi:poly[(R)-3-hydroxyalkanoate] polymerase subunit PhaC